MVNYLDVALFEKEWSTREEYMMLLGIQKYFSFYLGWDSIGNKFHSSSKAIKKNQKSDNTMKVNISLKTTVFLQLI